LLGGLRPAAFLRRFWQKRPHLVRGAIPGIAPFLSRDDLFDLASNAGVESRLVLEKGGEYPWQVRHGPFRPAELRRLPARCWTLLVQHVDLHVPAAAAILRRFRFVPGWRIDDLMVSYAPPGGGVGPHVDSYDVFLLQAAGTRRWRISRKRYSDADLVPGLDLRILRNFRADERWRLGPGDMLYLPPGVAHWGIAEDECMTCSVGFRAPGSREGAQRFLEEGGTEQPYRDPDLAVARHPGEITSAARRRIRRLLRAALADDAEIDLWFGREASAVPEGAAPTPPARPLSAAHFAGRIARAGGAQLVAASRAFYLRDKQGVVLFVNGRDYRLPRTCLAAVDALTATGGIAFSGKRVPAALQDVLYRLYREGVVVPGVPAPL
jgi:50S ribosomal protein L16 3-hydroxylase